MGVYRRSYIAAAGANTISAPELAFVTILDVTREGADQVQTTTPAAGTNQFSHNPDTGLLTFDATNPFNAAGEKIEVIYKGAAPPTPDPPQPPMTCDPVGSVTLSAVMSVLTVTVPISGNYLVDIIPAASACGDTPLQSGVITGGTSFVANALPDGSYKACVKVNCGGGLLSEPVASNTVVIATPPANFGARKVMPEPAKKILSITGVAYTIRYGSFPLTFGNQEMSGRHEGFGPSVITITVSVTKNQQVVVALYKNAVLNQFHAIKEPFTGNSTYSFAAISAASTDDIFIQMDYT